MATTNGTEGSYFVASVTIEGPENGTNDTNATATPTPTPQTRRRG